MRLDTRTGVNEGLTQMKSLECERVKNEDIIVTNEHLVEIWKERKSEKVGLKVESIKRVVEVENVDEHLLWISEIRNQIISVKLTNVQVITLSVKKS